MLFPAVNQAMVSSDRTVFEGLILVLSVKAHQHISLSMAMLHIYMSGSVNRHFMMMFSFICGLSLALLLEFDSVQ